MVIFFNSTIIVRIFYRDKIFLLLFLFVDVFPILFYDIIYMITVENKKLFDINNIKHLLHCTSIRMLEKRSKFLTYHFLFQNLPQMDLDSNKKSSIFPLGFKESKIPRYLEKNYFHPQLRQ